MRNAAGAAGIVQGGETTAGVMNAAGARAPGPKARIARLGNAIVDRNGEASAEAALQKIANRASKLPCSNSQSILFLRKKEWNRSPARSG
jgi:hypothetical protein